MEVRPKIIWSRYSEWTIKSNTLTLPGNGSIHFLIYTKDVDCTKLIIKIEFGFNTVISTKTFMSLVNAKNAAEKIYTLYSLIYQFHLILNNLPEEIKS